MKVGSVRPSSPVGSGGRRGARRRWQPRLEGLERRQPLSTIAWGNANGGFFTAGQNWQGGLAPTTGDTAVFKLPNNGTVTYYGNNPTVAAVSVADPTLSYFPVAAFDLTNTNATISGALNVGVSGSGGLTLTRSSDVTFPSVLNVGSVTVGQGGNGQLTITAKPPTIPNPPSPVPPTTLNIGGAVRIGQAATNSPGTLSVGGVLTAGSVQAELATINLGGSWTVNGPFSLSNGTQYAQLGGSLRSTGAASIGRSSTGQTTSVSITGVYPPGAMCPSPAQFETGALTLAATGSTDAASLNLNYSTLTTNGAAILAASRTVGTTTVTLQGITCAAGAIVPAIWNVNGGLTVGQLGGKAQLNVNSLSRLTSQDALIGSGIDSATGAAAVGSVNVAGSSSWTIVGNLSIGPTAGGGAGNGSLTVGGTVSASGPAFVSQNGSIHMAGGVLSAGSLSNGGGLVDGYGALILATPLGSSNFAISNPTGVFVGQLDVGMKNAYVYSRDFPTITTTIGGGVLRSQNGLLAQSRPGLETPNVMTGYGSILSSVRILESTDLTNYPVDWLDPTGVLTMTDLAFHGTHTGLKIPLSGPDPGNARGYGQVDLKGSVDLTDCLLQVEFGGGYTPAPGKRFTIINNDGADPIMGHFSMPVPNTNPVQYTSIPEGAILQYGGQSFTLTYKGGDGNDVQLIANQAPVPDAGGPYTVSEGGTVALSAINSTDPDQDPATLTYLWDLDGDGVFGESGPTATRGGERGRDVFYQVGEQDGPRNVTVALRVIDQGGLMVDTTASIQILNAAPTARFAAVGDPNVDEGSTINISFSGAADPSTADMAAGFTYAFDFNNDGTFESSGPATTVTVPAIYLNDGPAVRVIRGRVVDKDGGYNDYNLSIGVRNVAPIGDFTADSKVNEGQPITLAIDHVTDPSPTDTGAGFLYAFDFGDGKGFTDWTASPTASRTAVRGSTRTVVGRILDKDNGVREYTRQVQVVNLTPVINAGGPITLARGGTLDRSGSFSDPGAVLGEGYQGIVDYDDGTLPATLPLGAGGAFQLHHTFNLAGSFTVTVTVNDSNNGGSKATFRVDVQAPPVVPGDFDGDGKTDLGVFRPATAVWNVRPSGGGSTQTTQFGASRLDIPVPADYDGDGKADLAVYRPSDATWLVLYSGGGSKVFQFGQPNVDVPMPADYDGDGKADLAVFRPTEAKWLVFRSTRGAEVLQFGQAGVDRPVPADYDGDGVADLGVFRPTNATWYIFQSRDGARVVQFGAPNLDRPVPADYDGDGKADLAVFRPTTATYFVLRTTAGGQVIQFGQAGVDMPLAGDFDGDGAVDLGVYRPTTNQWMIVRSRDGVLVTGFGGQDDVPLPAALSYRYLGSLDPLRKWWG